MNEKNMPEPLKAPTVQETHRSIDACIFELDCRLGTCIALGCYAEHKQARDALAKIRATCVSTLQTLAVINGKKS